MNEEFKKLLEEEKKKNIVLQRKLLNKDIELGNLINKEKIASALNNKLKNDLNNLTKTSVDKFEFNKIYQDLLIYLAKNYKNSNDGDERLQIQNFIIVLKNLGI